MKKIKIFVGLGLVALLLGIAALLTFSGRSVNPDAGGTRATSITTTPALSMDEALIQTFTTHWPGVPVTDKLRAFLPTVSKFECTQISDLRTAYSSDAETLRQVGFTIRVNSGDALSEGHGAQYLTLNQSVYLVGEAIAAYCPQFTYMEKN